MTLCSFYSSRLYVYTYSTRSRIHFTDRCMYNIVLVSDFLNRFIVISINGGILLCIIRYELIHKSWPMVIIILVQILSSLWAFRKCFSHCQRSDSHLLLFSTSSLRILSTLRSRVAKRPLFRRIPRIKYVFYSIIFP